MKAANRYFVLGAAAAFFVMAVLGSGVLKKLYASGAYSRQPRELRLAQELGLCTYAQCGAKNLAQKTTASDFAEKLHKVFVLLGADTDKNKSSLEQKGITRPHIRRFTRQDAFETLSRAAKYLKEQKMISFGGIEAKNYSDYKIAQKYKEAASYLQGRFIVKGYPNGSFGKNRALTLKESIFFLYRFYEAVSADQMGKRPAEGLCFIDISTGHSIMNAIRNISLSGGFDKVILRASFDGNSVLTVSDLADIAGGIAEKAVGKSDIIRLKTIFAGSGAYCRRKHLALTLEYLADTLAKTPIKQIKPNYKDVSPSQSEYEALCKLSGMGICIGYKNRFAAEEFVSRFEAVNLINKLLLVFDKGKLRRASAMPIAFSRLANKTDLENFKARLRAKKEKIHRILTQNKLADSK